MKKLVSTDFSAENWLILGKKWSMMIATADKYGCRTLPMRNWHDCDATIGENEIFILSDITYEELTHFSSYSPNASVMTHSVGHYLWGIDTLWQKRVTSDPWAISRTLPMRNWHITLLLRSEALDYWNQNRRTLPMRNWHIAIMAIHLHIRSDITYEELTPVPDLEYCHIVCRTLPMRNWHKILHHKLSYAHLQVGHYLWGIDT